MTEKERPYPTWADEVPKQELASSSGDEMICVGSCTMELDLTKPLMMFTRSVPAKLVCDRGHGYTNPIVVETLWEDGPPTIDAYTRDGRLHPDDKYQTIVNAPDEVEIEIKAWATVPPRGDVVEIYKDRVRAESVVLRTWPWSPQIVELTGKAVVKRPPCAQAEMRCELLMQKQEYDKMVAAKAEEEKIKKEADERAELVRLKAKYEGGPQPVPST